MPKMGHASKKKVSDNSTLSEINTHENTRRSELAICAEENVSSTAGCYILTVCGTQCESEFRIAEASSDYTSSAYNVGEGINKIASFDITDSPIVSIKYSPTSRNILYTAIRNGVITACDLRAKGKIVATIQDTTPEAKMRPFCSLDVSNDDRLVVAGTEHVGGDAFILFWDLRFNNSKLKNTCDLLGGYWESHIDDITSLAFHPTKHDYLASGSTDGLINIFDLTKNSEESALKYSLNTESSVDRIGWLNNGNVWCTTHTHELQLWDCHDAQPYEKFERDSLGTYLNSDYDTAYVVRMHNNNGFNHPFLLAGSTSATYELGGLIIEDGIVDICFDLPGNKQLVRDSWYHEKSGILVTGGEMGILNLWKETETFAQNSVSKSLMKAGGKKRDKMPRPKPY